MRRGRGITLSLLLMAGCALLWWELQRPADPEPDAAHPQTAAAPRDPVRAASASLASAKSARSAAHAPGADVNFNRRLRCTQIHSALHRFAAPDVLELLCDRHPLGALQIEMPLAEAGDLHALAFLQSLWKGGSCEGPNPPSWEKHRARMLELAQKNGASLETLEHLDGLYEEEQSGPTPEELEACRQAGGTLERLKPQWVKQVTDTLGRSEQELRKEHGLDAVVMYARRMVVAGDAGDEEELAELLLEQDAPGGEAEAIRLLHEAAKTSASAKTRLARCLLSDCPGVSSDPAEAHALLTAAALAGDVGALQTLAGSTLDVQPDLLASERYAWSRFLQSLQQQGCFGSGLYEVWATSPTPPQTLLAMPPSDAAAAEARASDLLGAPLARARAALGCD